MQKCKRDIVNHQLAGTRRLSANSINGTWPNPPRLRARSFIDQQVGRDILHRHGSLSVTVPVPPTFFPRAGAHPPKEIRRIGSPSNQCRWQRNAASLSPPHCVIVESSAGRKHLWKDEPRDRIQVQMCFLGWVKGRRLAVGEVIRFLVAISRRPPDIHPDPCCRHLRRKFQNDTTEWELSDHKTDRP